MGSHPHAYLGSPAFAATSRERAQTKASSQSDSIREHAGQRAQVLGPSGPSITGLAGRVWAATDAEQNNEDDLTGSNTND